MQRITTGQFQPSSTSGACIHPRLTDSGHSFHASRLTDSLVFLDLSLPAIHLLLVAIHMQHRFTRQHPHHMARQHIGIGAWLFHEDDAARRIFTEQSHGEQWLRRLDDGEAPISDAAKDELRGVGDEDEVPLAHQWHVGYYCS